ncbi:MAG: type VI secretion system lipoprotein TssJ [Gammaproteobacteria bacterium]|nr:type VI secretion system lipoprotein TssJ [Gammaproteobacteria bacterium]
MHKQTTKLKPLLLWLFIPIFLSGCAQLSAIQLAGSAVGMVLEATGVTKKENADPSKITRDLNLRIDTGNQLNLTSAGKPLSLVAKIYVLRAADKYKDMTYQQIAAGETDKETLGEELVSVKEVVLLPGKSYDIKLKVPGDATTIGVAGMFRAPYQNRWKLAFDNKLSFDNGITIGAHACAFNATKGALVEEISPASFRSLVGIQCDS